MPSPKTPSSFSLFVPEQTTQPQSAPACSSAVSPPIVQLVATSTRARPIETNKTHSKKNTPRGSIEINTATEKELTTVPGIGHVMTARIIAARPFPSADDLKRVSGIGDKKYAQIRPYFSD